MKYLISSFFSLVSLVSYACSCANLGVITDEQYSYYDFIAKGTILSVEKGQTENIFAFEVEESFKEDQSKVEVVIYTSSSSGVMRHLGAAGPGVVDICHTPKREVRGFFV